MVQDATFQQWVADTLALFCLGYVLAVEMWIQLVERIHYRLTIVILTRQRFAVAFSACYFTVTTVSVKTGGKAHN